jgi:hypothetical protein
MRADRLAGLGTKGDGGDEMTVHDIHVNPVSALGFNGRDLCTEIREISGKDGWCDLDGAVK